MTINLGPIVITTRRRYHNVWREGVRAGRALTDQQAAYACGDQTPPRHTGTREVAR